MNVRTPDVAQIDEIVARLKEFDKTANEFYEKTSIDILGSGAKEFLNKLLVFSSVGVFVSIFGVTKNSLTISGLEILFYSQHIINLYLFILITYCGTAFFILYSADIRRWRAVYWNNFQTFNLLYKEIEEFYQRMFEIDKNNLEGLNKKVVEREDVGPLNDDGIPIVIADLINKMKLNIDTKNKLISSMVVPAKNINKNIYLMVCIFVYIPLIIGIVSVVLLALSSWRIYLAN